MAMLAKLQAQGQPAPVVENAVSGIVTKAKPKAKPKAESVEATAEQITVDGIDYIQITNESGRQFKFGVRKASEILDFVDAIADFVQAHS
jgi:maltodextrin utilization protein YvdJ